MLLPLFTFLLLPLLVAAASDQEFIVFIHSGNPVHVNTAKEMATKNQIQIINESINDDMEHFNLLLVKGEQSHVESAMKSNLWDVFPNQDLTVELDESRHLHKRSQDSGYESWGLSMISSRYSGYAAPESGGEGTTVYVLDSGIDTTHPEFAGKRIPKYSFVENNQNCDKDCYFHGTFVAGIIGGRLFGVAKKVNLVDIRVLDSKGVASGFGFYQGFQKVLQLVQQRPHRAIINYSVGGSRRETMVDGLVNQLYRAGIHIVQAAGNDGRNRCSDPRYANTRQALFLVGAVNRNNVKWTGSNYGDCVDVYAPGEDVRSVVPRGRIATDTGTSHAAPVVAGVLALALTEKRFADVGQAYAYLRSISRPAARVPGSNALGLVITNGVASTCQQNCRMRQ